MYKSVLEFNFKDFDTANYIFNDFDRYFEPSRDLIPLSNISDDLYMPILKKHGFDITWEDIKNNEELYELLEKMVNEANIDAEYIGFLEGHKSKYTEKFDKIGEFLEDEGIYDYIHNIQADIDTDKGVFRIKYEYDDKDVINSFLSIDENEYYENKEDYRREFEYDIKLDIKGIIRDFDEYMGRLFADARGYEFYDFTEGENAFMYRFEDLVIEYKDKLKKLTGK